MKIIKKGSVKKPAWRITCGKCGSRLEFTSSDVRPDRDGDYIICPVCGAYLSTDKPMHSSPGSQTTPAK